MRLRHGELGQLDGASSFQWMAGIDDTFITAASPRTGRTLDGYELTGHYERWREDIDLFAQLGLTAVRYGIPWHRINPQPGVWDFGWADAALERLLEHGIHPIVDLVHHGVPPWIEDAYLAPDFGRHMAEYAVRVAERYRGRVHGYTPLNEPRVAAWYCGRLGWWPPFRRGWSGFVQVMLGVCRGIVETCRALREVDPELVQLHVDATDLYEPAEPAVQAEAARRQDLVFLPLDLVTGRLLPGHPLHEWLLANGAGSGALDWFAHHAIEPDLLGINFCPLFSLKRVVRTASGLRLRMPYASADVVERLAELYWARYRTPLVISETASEGSLGRRLAWLDASVTATARVRAAGIPLVGYTWWPLFALVTWAYREGRKPPHDYLRQMGLWDLRPQGDSLERVPTALVVRYRELVAGGSRAVGPLATLLPT